MGVSLFAVIRRPSIALVSGPYRVDQWRRTMAIEERAETEIGVTLFKAKCLALIDDVFKGKTSRVVLMKHNKPVAAIVPIGDRTVELWGSMQGTVKIASDTDLTAPMGEIWDADD